MSVTTPTNPVPENPERFGTFDAMGTYIPVQITEDDLGDVSLEEAIDRTIHPFEDGDIVKGTVV